MDTLMHHPEPAPTPPPMIPRTRSRSPRISPVASSIGAVIGAIVAVVGSLAITVAAGIMLTVSSGNPIPDEAAVNELITSLPFLASSILVTALALIGAPLLTAKITRADTKEALGFRSAPWPVFFLAPIGILALGPTSDLMVRFMAEFFPSWTFGALDQLEGIVRDNNPFLLWPLIALCPGFSEEIFFRGLIQRSWGFGWKAITISAITFSLFHMDPHHIAGVLPLGFYLAWLGARTGSLWVPVVAHTVNNTFALIASVAEIQSMDAAEEMPIWAAPVGWVIAGAIIYGIHRLTRDRARWLGPAAEAS